MADSFRVTRNLKWLKASSSALKRFSDCDADTPYIELEQIGFNMRNLGKLDPSVEYLKDLHGKKQ